MPVVSHIAACKKSMLLALWILLACSLTSWVDGQMTHKLFEAIEVATSDGYNMDQKVTHTIDVR